MRYARHPSRAHHTTPVRRLAFLADDAHVVSLATDDRAVVVWAVQGQVAGAAASPPSTYSGGRPYDDVPRSYDDDDENFPPDSPSNDGGGDPDWPF